MDRHAARRKTLARNLRPAIVAIASVAAAFLTMLPICAYLEAGPDAAIMAAFLSLGLGRRPNRSHLSPLVTLAALPLIAAGAALAGWLLHSNLAIGAAVFIAGMFLSIWVRRFGERAAAIGATLALPLIAILVLPLRPHARGGPLVGLALVMVAGLVAFGWTLLARFVAERTGFVPAPPVHEEMKTPPRPSRSRIAPSTRMAVQMAVALTAAFAIGPLLFPQHWAWVVLTAFIVCSGSRGREEAAYKALARLAGAIAGTLAAAAVQPFALPNAGVTAAIIFLAIFLGIWLRPLNYAYWAGCLTLVLALLQRAEGGFTFALLGARLEAILAGAFCGVLAAWFVLPMRIEQVARRFLADALLALDDLVANADATQHARTLHAFERHVQRIDQLAPPLELHRRLRMGSRAGDHPLVWIEILRTLLAHARTLAAPNEIGERRPAVRRAIGASRKAIAQPSESVTEPLRRLHETLAAATPIDATKSC